MTSTWIGALAFVLVVGVISIYFAYREKRP